MCLIEIILFCCFLEISLFLMGYLVFWNLVCFKNGWCVGGLVKLI